MDDEEIMETFDQYSQMPPLPGLTEEKWKSLSDLQREEMFSEYYSRREKDEEIKRLKNRKKQGARLFVDAKERKTMETKRTSPRARNGRKMKTTHITRMITSRVIALLTSVAERVY